MQVISLPVRAGRKIKGMMMSNNSIYNRNPLQETQQLQHAVLYDIYDRTSELQQSATPTTGKDKRREKSILCLCHSGTRSLLRATIVNILFFFLIFFIRISF